MALTPSVHRDFVAWCRALSRIGLAGPLPAGLGVLTKLATLDLSFNQLTGGVPEGWGSSQSMPAVQELVLTSNQLGGFLPPAWGGSARFPNLTSLQLGTNQIAGSLPFTWSKPGVVSHPRQLAERNFIVSTCAGGQMPHSGIVVTVWPKVVVAPDFGSGFLVLVLDFAPD